MSLTLSLTSGCGDDDSAPRTPAPAAQEATLEHEKIEAALSAAGRYFDGGDDAKAEAILLALEKQVPDEPRAQEMLATILLARADGRMRRGQSEEAKALYEGAYARYQRVLALTEPQPGMHQSAGRVAQAAGMNDLALEHFRTAGELAPHDPAHAVLEANLLLQLQRVDEARTAIDRALILDDAEPYALATLAIVLKEEGRDEEAIERMREAREVARPQDQLNIRVLEARLHRQLNNPERALQLLLPLPEAERAHEAVAYEIAESSVAMGNRAQAVEAWGVRFRLTEDWRAALAAARHAFAADALDEAWQWMRQAELHAPSAPEVREFYGTLRDRMSTVEDETSAAD